MFYNMKMVIIYGGGRKTRACVCVCGKIALSNGIQFVWWQLQDGRVQG